MLVGYARVSTQEQNLDLQIDALKKAGCEKIFTEKASGAQRERPELKAALEYMRAGQDCLVVWKLDRLARSLKQLIATIEELEKQKIGFASVTEGLDTQTPGGKLVFHMFGALAEFERSIIRERTMAGLEAAQAKGKLLGRPGVLKDEDIMAAKALLKNTDMNVRDIAKRVGVSKSTFYKYFPGGRAEVE